MAAPCPGAPLGCLLLGGCSLPASVLPPGEIDRCLKKVSEGVEQFEDIWQKVRGLGLRIGLQRAEQEEVPGVGEGVLRT